MYFYFFEKFNLTQYGAITFNFNQCLPRMLSACSYVYADKFTACVQNVRLPNACMLWVAHATGKWMCRWRLVQCCCKRSADAVAVRQHFESLIDALLHCSQDFVVHWVKIWTVRWPLFRWNKARCVSGRKSWIVSRARLKHELIPWYLPNEWRLYISLNSASSPALKVALGHLLVAT